MDAILYKRKQNTGDIASDFERVNLDATNYTVTFGNYSGGLGAALQNFDDYVLWKTTTSNTYPRLYYVSADGSTQGVWGFTSSVVAGTIVQRDNDGHVKVATPTNDEDAASKSYVDNNYVSLSRSETIQGLKTFERRPRITVGAVEYTYLQSQGYNVLGASCPYIDTGIKLTATQNMLVEYDIEITSNEAAFIAGIDGATGVGSNDSNYWYMGTAGSTSAVNTHTRQILYELIRITSSTKYAELYDSASNRIAYRTGAAIATYSTNTTYPIFAIKNSSDAVLQNNSKHSAGAKIYHIRIYIGAPESLSELHNSAYLVAEYIPAKLGETNGFFDSVNHYFITSANAYAFDIGDEVGPIDSNYENVALMSDLPAVGEGTLTLQRNGVYQGQFNANTVADATINITVPTSISDLGGCTWDDVSGKPTLSISGNTITIGSQSTTWTDTNTAGLSWDSTNHAVKSSLDNTSATIPTATTTTQGIIAIGTASTQAAAGNHTHSAYVNQNAYSNIKVGSTATGAGNTMDTITFAAGGDLSVSISGKTITYSVTLSALSTKTETISTLSVSGTGITGSYANGTTFSIGGSMAVTPVSTMAITTVISTTAASDTKIPTEKAVVDAISTMAPASHYHQIGTFSNGILTLDTHYLS